MNDFQQEWIAIHSDIERYEQYSLIIKLFGVLICLLSVVYQVEAWFATSLILVLWLQDGIWKTFQHRLEVSILSLEQKKQGGSDESNSSFQLYTQWNGQRQGIVAMIREYLSNSVRPTVAYPYPLLVLMVLVVTHYSR